MAKLRFYTIFAALLLLGLPSLWASEILAVDLEPKTLDAFNRYVKLTQERIDKEVTQPGAFLYVERLPESDRLKVHSSLQKGEIYMERLETHDPSGSTIEAPDGLIHHWIGTVFIPGANLHQVITLVQDYDHHQDIYQPDVVRSRLVHRDGNDFQIYYRLVKRKVITVTLDTNHEVRYFPIDARHCRSRSTATRIAEVVNAGGSDEYEKPIGHDGGFLWRLNSDWRFEERDGGVYVECESVSLTRDIPTGFGWIVKPFVTSIPRESLLMTLTSTRSAVEARGHAVASR